MHAILPDRLPHCAAPATRKAAHVNSRARTTRTPPKKGRTAAAAAAAAAAAGGRRPNPSAAPPARAAKENKKCLNKMVAAGPRSARTQSNALNAPNALNVPNAITAFNGIRTHRVTRRDTSMWTEGHIIVQKHKKKRRGLFGDNLSQDEPARCHSPKLRFANQEMRRSFGPARRL